MKDEFEFCVPHAMHLQTPLKTLFRLGKQVALIVDELEKLPTISLYNDLRVKINSFEKIAKITKQRINDQKTDRLIGNSALDALEKASDNIHGMAFTMALLEERAETIAVKHFIPERHLDALLKNTMPNTKTYTNTVTAQLLDTLKQNGHFSDESIQRIIGINAKRLCEELYGADENSVVSMKLKGISDHYLEVLEENSHYVNAQSNATTNNEKLLMDEKASMNDQSMPSTTSKLGITIPTPSNNALFKPITGGKSSVIDTSTQNRPRSYSLP